MNQMIKTRIEQIGRGEVPEGYKKTKVGIVPCDWGESKLKDISMHGTRKNTDNSIHLTFTNSATQGVIKQTDYFDKEIANQDNTRGYYIVEKNDYIYNPRISVSAPCGPINQSHFEETGIVSPLYTVFKMKKGYEENRYFEFYFKSSYWYKYMQSVANYGARHDRMNITNDDLFGMPIPMPAAEEQERIAEILGTQDKLIALKEKRIAEKKQQKKYLMQQLLTGKKRLPGFTGEWEAVKLNELCSIKTGKLDANKAVENGKYPFFTCGKETLRIDDYAFDGDAILLAGNGDVGQTKIYSGKFNAYQRTYVLMHFKMDYKLIRNYIDLLIEKVVNVELQGGAMPYIKLQTLENLKFYISTDKKEQQAITNILSQADKEIELLQKDLEEEKNKKKALMQLLLTGIVRTVDL